MAELTGQCQCGKITYRIDASPAWCGHCHCRQCQKIHGSSFTTWVGFKSPELKFDDPHKNLKTFNSGRANRFFCGECGSHLAFRYTKPDAGRDPEQHLYSYVTAASLDEVPPIKFDHVYKEEQPAWTKDFVHLPE